MLEPIKEFLTPETLAIIIPILIAVYSLVAYCVLKIIKEGVANLNKTLWTIIVISANLVGSIVFLLFGRRRDL